MVYVDRATLTNRRLMSLSDVEALIKELGLKCRGAGSVRGYTTRAPHGMREVWSYKGKYGEGLAFSVPRFDTTNYSYLVYYVK